jgi:signal peptidase I
MDWKTALITFGLVMVALIIYGFVIQPFLIRVAAR